MAQGLTMLVSPEDGDGESWYYEVTRFGEVWDGRADTEEQARTDAADLFARMLALQETTGQTASKPIRRAVIRGLGHDKLATIRRYLPSNYTADSDGGDIWITGVDSAGWTLDGYVIPRLASGLYRAEEVR